MREWMPNQQGWVDRGPRVMSAYEEVDAIEAILEEAAERAREDEE